MAQPRKQRQTNGDVCSEVQSHSHRRKNSRMANPDFGESSSQHPSFIPPFFNRESFSSSSFLSEFCFFFFFLPPHWHKGLPYNTSNPAPTAYLSPDSFPDNSVIESIPEPKCPPLVSASAFSKTPALHSAMPTPPSVGLVPRDVAFRALSKALRPRSSLSLPSRDYGIVRLEFAQCISGML